MGRNRNRNTNNTNNQKDRAPYQDIIKENDKFIKYYQTQKICPVTEWDNFINHIKSDLPTAFRITGSKGESKRMLEIVEKELLRDCVTENVDENKPTMYPLPWYPEKLAWQLDLTRKDIRRMEAYYKLHNFLITETENGTISRQETVSMIPPLLLDIKSHHKVLDMCAAPGSKTAQLLELLHADETKLPSGYVIANDIDNKRCYMLVHQAKRLNSPCIAVMNHDSAVLPNFKSTREDGSITNIQFDRILCDVPCSGDGTLRKNPDIWMKWTPANALNLHGIQYRILKRGIELLSVGGRLVYSTCSLNPIENEAVIHHLLSDMNDSVRLVDASKMLPGLIYTPGAEDWLVGSRNLEFYKSFDEVDDKWKTTIRPQMFPPKLEDRSKFNLNRCIRILPHHQNTGAFFVAVLEKINPINEQDTKDSNCNRDEQLDNKNIENNSQKRLNDDRLPHNQRKRRRNNGYREDPFVFFTDDEKIWPEIKEYYNINDQFDVKCLLVRCHEGKKKNIYYTSPAMRDLVVQNQGLIKFINTGVKAFVRSDNRNMKCAFRIAYDGLESIFYYVGDNRKVNINKTDLLRLLTNNDPLNSPPIESLTEEVKQQVEPLSPGSCILMYKDEEKEDFILHLSGWRGTTSLRCYTSQHSIVHLLRLLGGDITKYDVNKFKKAIDENLEEKVD